MDRSCDLHGAPGLERNHDQQSQRDVCRVCGRDLGGLGTIYVIGWNGVLIGVVAAACHQAAMSIKLWSFVAPHGSLEIPAILLAGAAGLRLAARTSFPGALPPGTFCRGRSRRRAAPSGNDSNVGGCRDDRRILFALGCAGCAEIHCGRAALRGPPDVAFPGGPG